MSSLRQIQLLAAFLIVLSGNSGRGQDASGSAAPMKTNMGAMSGTNDMKMMEHMEEMDAMAKSMTSMADMCRMMMDEEMKRMPLRVAAGVIFGSLVTVALALFVVL